VPVHLNVELTDRCNLRCRMCGQSQRPQGHGGPGSDMDEATWLAALEGLAGMPEEVHLCPHWLGEPTLHPAFDRLVALAFERNAGNRLFRTFKLHTNGILLGPDRARLLLDLAGRPDQAPDTFRAVHFSLDAWSRTVYREVKGADLQPRAARHVRGFLEARERTGRAFPRVHLAFVVQEGNAGDAAAFVRGWGALLDRLGRPWELTPGWPGDDRDAIYLRPLNGADPVGAGALHAATWAALRAAWGLPPEPPPTRAPEAF